MVLGINAVGSLFEELIEMVIQEQEENSYQIPPHRSLPDWVRCNNQDECGEVTNNREVENREGLVSLLD